MKFDRRKNDAPKKKNCIDNGGSACYSRCGDIRRKEHLKKKAHPSSLKRRRPQKVKGRIQESLKTAVYYRLGALHPVELTISYII